MIPLTFAEEKVIQIREFEIGLQRPSSWQMPNGFLGRDIVLLGKGYEGIRETVFIEATKSELINFDLEKKDGEKYKETKISWLKEKKGILNNINLNKELSFLKRPYLYKELSYNIEGKEVIEGDLILKCSDDVVLAMAILSPKKLYSSFFEDFKHLATSLRCKMSKD